MLIRFAKNVSISVTIAQAAALVNRMNARVTGVTYLLVGVGSMSVRGIGRVCNALLIPPVQAHSCNSRRAGEKGKANKTRGDEGKQRRQGTFWITNRKITVAQL